MHGPGPDLVNPTIVNQTDGRRTPSFRKGGAQFSKIRMLICTCSATVNEMLSHSKTDKMSVIEPSIWLLGGERACACVRRCVCALRPCIGPMTTMTGAFETKLLHSIM